MKKLFATLVLSVISLSFGYAAQLDLTVQARIARIEHGLLPEKTESDGSLHEMPLTERMAALKVPGISIAVINHGEIEWARGYGLASVAEGIPVTEHTRFQAASISKPVAAIAALYLVQKGKLSLDENVNQRLTTWKLPDNAFTAQRKVTLRALLSHTAGIGVHGYLGYSERQPIPTLLQILDGELPANSAPVRVENIPDSAWKYSGGGYEIVQLLLTETSHEQFDKFAKRVVLDKIGMYESSFTLPAEWEPLASRAYLADGSAVAGKWHHYPEMAAASLWSTPSDLARLAIEIQKSLVGQSNKVLSQKMTVEMVTPGIETFGLGLFLGEETDKHKSFRHSGGAWGFRNMMFAYNSTGQGAVVMTNSDNGGQLVEEVLRAIAREYGWTNYLVKNNLQ